MTTPDVYTEVDRHYSAASGSATPQYSSTVAKSFGYTDEDLAQVAEGSNLGLSCGNPIAMASIAEGEVVIDLGSGAGFDAFQAAKKVGASGRVIGVDMNKDMLAKANKIRSDTGATNVSFVESKISDIGVLDSGTANCIISNCVINLVPAAEKLLVFREMFRLLKPGGRVAVSDILAKKPLPENIRSDMALYVGCIAGACQVMEADGFLREAGFQDILIVDTKSDLNVYTDTLDDGSRQTTNTGEAKHEESGCCVSSCQNNQCSRASDTDLNEWTGSFRIYAVKK